MTGPSDLRRRVDEWRLAERREQVLRADEGPLAPEAALAAAADLLDWWAASAPGGVDPLREREVAAARAAWRALRERLGCPTPLPR